MKIEEIVREIKDKYYACRRLKSSSIDSLWSEAVYFLLVMDWEDMIRVVEWPEKLVGDLAARYEKSKEEFYDHIREKYREKYGVLLSEEPQKSTTWHFLGDEKTHRKAIRGRDGGIYLPKIYIKVGSNHLAEEGGMERYFNMLGKVTELLLNKDWFCKLKMPKDFGKYVVRKDGCIFYLKDHDAVGLSESLNDIYRVVRNTFGKDARLVLGYDRIKDGGEDSYSEVLANTIVELSRSNNYRNMGEALRDAILQIEKNIGGVYGHLARDFGPFTNI